MRRGPGASPGAHQPVMEAEEVQPLASHGQVHDPGLGRFRLQAEIGQQASQPRQRGFGLPRDWQHTTRSSANRASVPCSAVGHARSSRCR
jgi:hypothetical protein